MLARRSYAWHDQLGATTGRAAAGGGAAAVAELVEDLTKLGCVTKRLDGKEQGKCATALLSLPFARFGSTHPIACFLCLPFVDKVVAIAALFDAVAVCETAARFGVQPRP